MSAGKCFFILSEIEIQQKIQNIIICFHQLFAIWNGTFCIIISIVWFIYPPFLLSVPPGVRKMMIPRGIRLSAKCNASLTYQIAFRKLSMRGSLSAQYLMG